MAQNFMTDEQMAAASPDVSDMDPQSAAQMPGFKKIVGAIVDDVPNAPGDDSIKPDYNSPIETIGFAAPKLGMSATEAIANGLSHSDFAKLAGNEVGSIGRNVGKGIKVVEETPQDLGKVTSSIKDAGKPNYGKVTMDIRDAGKPKYGKVIVKPYADGGEVSSPDFMTDEQMNGMQAQAPSPQSNFMTDDQMKSLQSDEEKYSTPSQQAIAGIEGAARGIAGPLAPLAEQGLNKALFNQSVEETNKNIRGREEANPATHAIAEGTAMLGSMVAGVGEAGLIAKGASAVTKALEGTTLASKIGTGAARAFIENAALQSGDEASKMIIQDPNTSTQTAITNVGLAGLLGGTLGGGLEVTKGLWKASVGSKAGQMLEDFKGRIDEHMANPDPQFSLNKELTDHYNNIKQVADDVYGPTGIKALDIEKAMPEMSEKIAKQASETTTKVGDKVIEMTKNGYKYPKRLAVKLEEDLNNYNTLVAAAKTPGEIFNATQDLKQTLQGYAKYDTFIKPTDEAYDFAKESKKLAFDLRNSLEDKAVWGKAAERQQVINKAFTEFKPALKDFESKFTSEVGGEKLIDANKIKSYLSSIGKPSAEIKQSMLSNFLDASEKYAKVLGESHANIGIDSPIQPSSLQFANSTLKRATTGRKLADIFINRGLTETGGKALGATAGAGIGHALGIGKEVGALIGAHALGPFFSSVLPAITKPILGIMAHPEAFREVSEYGASVAKGEKLLNRSVAAVFTDKDVIPASKVPTDKETFKLDKLLNGIRTNASALLNIGGNSGHYLPDHASSMASTATNATTFLNNSRPDNHEAAPLDTKVKIPPYKANQYNNLLKLAQQPLIALDKMKNGTLTHQDVIAIQTMYPDLYKSMSNKLTAEIVSHKTQNKIIPYKIRLGMSLFLQQPLDSTMTPIGIMSTQKALGGNASRNQQQPQNNQKPPAASSMKEMNKEAAANRTPAQARQYNRQTKD